MKQALLALLLFCHVASAWTLVSGSAAGWETRKLTVYFNPAACGLAENELIPLIDEAVRSWNGVPTAELTLSRAASQVTLASFLAGTATEVPAILCDPNFATTNGVDRDRIPAVTRLSGQGKLDYGGVILNSEPGAGAALVSLTPEQRLVTIAHELGHVLGLGHSSSTDALMYFSIGGKTTARLSKDDRDGVTFLYPRNELAAGTPFGCAAVHGRRPEPWSWLAAALYLVGVVKLGRLLSLRGWRLSSGSRRPS